MVDRCGQLAGIQVHDFELEVVVDFGHQATVFQNGNEIVLEGIRLFFKPPERHQNSSKPPEKLEWLKLSC